MKIKVGKVIFSFVLMLFTLRLIAAPAVMVENSNHTSQDQLNPLNHPDDSPLKVFLGDLSSANENETENEEEGKSQQFEHEYLSFFNHQLAVQFDPAVCRHHYPVNSKELTNQTALYISFCIYRI